MGTSAQPFQTSTVARVALDDSITSECIIIIKNIN